MKQHIYFFLLLLAPIPFSHAQNSDAFFKIPPSAVDTAHAPFWAKLMYSSDPNTDEVVSQYDLYYSQNAFEKNIHTQNFKYWYKSIRSYIASDGHIYMPSPQDQARIYSGLKAQRNASSRANTWSNIGPFDTYKNDGSLELRPTQTNITSIAVAPSNHDILYCGAATGGGVFKSIDHGLNWNLVTRDEPITDAADIKIHPQNPDTVYICNGSNIYQTLDGGVTWTLNFTAPGRVEQFYIHRTQPHIVFAATASGLFQTLNDGATWTNIFNQKCWDIEAHATNPNTLFLATHNPTAKRAEVYKSTNNGTSWVLKDNLWYTPTTLAAATDIGCKIGVTPADTNRVYAALIGDSKAGDNGWIGIYYSLNGADSWVNADGIDGGPYVSGNNASTNWFYAGYSNGYHQGWYNFDMDVSHINPDRIWVGTIWACESGNRGANIEYIRGTRSLEMHADIQDIDVVGNEIWYTSDGGINYSDDEMQSVEIRNTGISASTYWGFSQGWNHDVWTGGRYHNGDAVYREEFGGGKTMFLGGAETATGYINPLNNNLLHFSDISDKEIGYSLSTPSSEAANLGIYPNEAYTLLNSSEVEYHPNYANHLYLGNDNVFYQSTNGGAQFDTLFTFAAGSRVLTFEISRVAPQIMYCLVKAGNTGTIYRSTDGGNSFVPTSAVPSNSLSALDLSLDPSSTNSLWVISAYGANRQKVYASTDGGQSWTNKSTATLDNHRILDIVYQAGTNDVVYIVTDYGVFYWDVNTSDWVMYSDGLPFLTRALSLKLFYRDSKIRLSSDRGIWEAPFATLSLPKAEPMTENNIVWCSRDTVQLEDHSFLDHADAHWLWNIFPAPAYISSQTARNPKVVFAENGTYAVSLMIQDSAGNQSTKTVPDFITVNSQCLPDSVPGLALHCEANPDHANIPNLALAQVDSFTISAWVKPQGIQPDYTGIVINNGETAGLNFRPGNVLAYHWPGGAWWWNSGLVVDTAVWSHVALVAKPGSMTLYLNGVAATHNTNITPVDIGTMKIGSYKGWASRNYTGEIDEVCIWNKALSQDEIRELRHLTRTGSQPFTDGLVAYYQFNLPNSSDMMDKVGIAHGSVSGNAQKVISSAPVGGGESHRLTVNAAGNVIFSDTETEINFGASHPNGEVVVSRLHISPNVLPSANPHTGNYWVVNNYGSPAFSALNEIKFKPANAVILGNAADARLYRRAENDHLNSWVPLCVANSNTGTYSYSSGCNITETFQFFIQSVNSNAIARQTVFTQDFASICHGDSILLAGFFRHTSGMYHDTVHVSASLDSVHRTTLDVTTINTDVTLNGAVLTADEVGATYQWIDCATNTIRQREILRTFNPGASGLYAVEIKKDGCVDTSACIPFIMTSLSLPGLGSPGNDKPQLSMDVVPNPTDGEIQIKGQLETDQSAAWLLFDLHGKEVRKYHQELDSGAVFWEIDLGELPGGMYLYYLQTGEGVKTGKLWIK